MGASVKAKPPARRTRARAQENKRENGDSGTQPAPNKGRQARTATGPAKKDAAAKRKFAQQLRLHILQNAAGGDEGANDEADAGVTKAATEDGVETTSEGDEDDEDEAKSVARKVRNETAEYGYDAKEVAGDLSKKAAEDGEEQAAEDGAENAAGDGAEQATGVDDDANEMAEDGAEKTEECVEDANEEAGGGRGQVEKDVDDASEDAWDGGEQVEKEVDDANEMAGGGGGQWEKDVDDANEDAWDGGEQVEKDVDDANEDAWDGGEQVEKDVDDANEVVGDGAEQATGDDDDANEVPGDGAERMTRDGAKQAAQEYVDAIEAGGDIVVAQVARNLAKQLAGGDGGENRAEGNGDDANKVARKVSKHLVGGDGGTKKVATRGTTGAQAVVRKGYANNDGKRVACNRSKKATGDDDDAKKVAPKNVGRKGGAQAVVQKGDEDNVGKRIARNTLKHGAEDDGNAKMMAQKQGVRKVGRKGVKDDDEKVDDDREPKKQPRRPVLPEISKVPRKGVRKGRRNVASDEGDKVDSHVTVDPDCEIQPAPDPPKAMDAKKVSTSMFAKLSSKTFARQLRGGGEDAKRPATKGKKRAMTQRRDADDDDDDDDDDYEITPACFPSDAKRLSTPSSGKIDSFFSPKPVEERLRTRLHKSGVEQPQKKALKRMQRQSPKEASRQAAKRSPRQPAKLSGKQTSKQSASPAKRPVKQTPKQPETQVGKPPGKQDVSNRSACLPNREGKAVRRGQSRPPTGKPSLSHQRSAGTQQMQPPAPASSVNAARRKERVPTVSPQRASKKSSLGSGLSLFDNPRGAGNKRTAAQVAADAECDDDADKEVLGDLDSKSRPGPMKKLKSSSCSNPKHSELVGNLNLRASRIRELEDFNRFVRNSLDEANDKIQKLLKEKREDEAAIKGLQAAVTVSVATDPRVPDISSRNGQQSKRSKAIREKEIIAREKALLSPLRSYILKQCNGETKEYCKAIVRQQDPAQWILGNKVRVHAWMPSPRKLSEALAKKAKCKTPGYGNLGDDGEDCGLALEPPMLSSARNASEGGLYGIHAKKASDYLPLLAKLIATKSSTWIELLDENGNRASNMSEETIGRECEAVCSSLAATDERRLMGSTISGQIGYHKQCSVENFCRSLGYTVHSSTGPGNEEKRVKEAVVMVERICGFGITGAMNAEGKPANSEEMSALFTDKPHLLVEFVTDFVAPERISQWRKGSFADQCSAKALGRAYLHDVDVEEVDILFANAMARKCYSRWMLMNRKELSTDPSAGGVTHLPGDASILSLARLDAWMCASLIMGVRKVPVDLEGQRIRKEAGHNKNGWHNEIFEILLPRAIEGILGTIREQVQNIRPDELYMPFDVEKVGKNPEPEDYDCAEGSRVLYHGEDGNGHEGDVHGQKWRILTSSHLSPYDQRHYVVALPAFIKTHVCSWIGDVKDATVGVCDEGIEYVRVTADMAQSDKDADEEGDDGDKEDRGEEEEEREEEEEDEEIHEEGEEDNSAREEGEEKEEAREEYNEDDEAREEEERDEKAREEEERDEKAREKGEEGEEDNEARKEGEEDEEDDEEREEGEEDEEARVEQEELTDEEDEAARGEAEYQVEEDLYDDRQPAGEDGEDEDLSWAGKEGGENDWD